MLIAYHKEQEKTMPKTKLEICSYSRETRRSAAVIQSQQTGKVMKLQIADAIRD